MSHAEAPICFTAGGGKTKIRFTPGGKVPNVQVGDRNVMVIGADGDSLKSKSKPKKPKNVKLTGESGRFVPVNWIIDPRTLVKETRSVTMNIFRKKFFFLLNHL